MIDLIFILVCGGLGMLCWLWSNQPSIISGVGTGTYRFLAIMMWFGALRLIYSYFFGASFE
tara:strand:+ start:227 stop:409 length:183 start_codon:yes stop_codon:yes gene_type:complete